MCGRYASILPPDLLASMFLAVLGRMTNLEPNWNVAPTQAGAVVRVNRHRKRTPNRRLKGTPSMTRIAALVCVPQP